MHGASSMARSAAFSPARGGLRRPRRSRSPAEWLVRATHKAKPRYRPPPARTAPAAPSEWRRRAEAPLLDLQSLEVGVVTPQGLDVGAGRPEPALLPGQRQLSRATVPPSSRSLPCTLEHVPDRSTSKASFHRVVGAQPPPPRRAARTSGGGPASSERRTRATALRRTISKRRVAAPLRSARAAWSSPCPGSRWRSPR